MALDVAIGPRRECVEVVRTVKEIVGKYWTLDGGGLTGSGMVEGVSLAGTFPSLLSSGFVLIVAFGKLIEILRLYRDQIMWDQLGMRKVEFADDFDWLEPGHVASVHVRFVS